MSDNLPASAGELRIAPMRRFRIRISVRALMSVVLVIGIVLGWYIYRARLQRAAVRAIQARGGIVEYDYKYDSSLDQRNRKGKTWTPAWLQNAVGDDNFLHHVAVVGLDMDISLRPIDVADADLIHLEGFTHLKVLYAGGGHVTDAGLEHLRNMTELRMLVLWNNPISGAGLKYLRRLKKLRHLDLNNTAVTEEQLANLRELTGLERIDLANNPQLTGSFLEHVADLPNLKELVLRGSGITDSALIHLKRARNLHSLMLDRTNVTDEGLSHLRDFKSLRALDLTQTAVTASGVASIKAQIPPLSVLYSPPKNP